MTAPGPSDCHTILQLEAPRKVWRPRPSPLPRILTRRPPNALPQMTFVAPGTMLVRVTVALVLISVALSTVVLPLCAAPCAAARGVRGAATTSFPAPGAPVLANAVHLAGGPPSPIHGTGDESASNAKMRRHTEASGAAVGCPGTAVCVLPIAPPPRVPSPMAGTDKERRAVVVLGRAGKVESGMSVACPYCGGKGRTAQPGTTGRGGHAFLRVWSAAVLSVVSVAGVGVASVRSAGGSLISRGGACASSHGRRWLRSAMVGLAVMSSGGAGVAAAVCQYGADCSVCIPTLDPLMTTRIDINVCSEGTL